MSRKKFVALVACLALCACSTANTDSDQAATETTGATEATSTQPEAEPAPEPEVVPLIDRPETLKLSDFDMTEIESGISLTGEFVSFQVPGGFTNVPKDGAIFNFTNDAGQTFTLVPVGEASAVSTPEAYVEALNASGNLGEGEAQYWGDVSFGAETAWQFEVVGASPASIYAFSFDTIAYELTITAPESYLLEELRPSIAQTWILSPGSDVS